MDLKTFQAGIAFLAKATNQRSKEPDPFLVQVGKDGFLSLISGNQHGTYVWRTLIPAGPPRKEGISSKLLTQASKTLKGKLDITFEVTATEFVVRTSAGGTVSLAYGPELPTLIKPPKGELLATALFEEGRLSRLVDAFEVADTSGFYGMVSFVPDDHHLKSRVVTTDRYILFQTYVEMDERLPTTYSVPTAFWKPLQPFKTAAVALFQETGVRVSLGQFEAYSARSEFNPDFLDYKNEYFPEGKQPDTSVILDRKVLIGSIKSLDDEWVFIERKETGEVILSGRTSGQFVGIAERKGKGAARNSFLGSNMTAILGAIDSTEVVIGWNYPGERPRPFLIAGWQRTGDLFMLSPLKQVV